MDFSIEYIWRTKYINSLWVISNGSSFQRSNEPVYSIFQTFPSLGGDRQHLQVTNIIFVLTDNTQYFSKFNGTNSVRQILLIS